MANQRHAGAVRATGLGKLVRHGIAIAAAALALAGFAPEADAQTPVLKRGNAIATGFAGTVLSNTPAPGGDPVDSTFIDLEGASMRLQDVSAGGQPPQGQLIPAPTVFQAKAKDVGQVFGIALDDGRGPDGVASGTPDIYLSATSMFGLQILQPDAGGALLRARTGNPGAQWMPGQWGDPAKGATPGSIWKVNGTIRRGHALCQCATRRRTQLRRRPGQSHLSCPLAADLCFRPCDGHDPSHRYAGYGPWLF